MYVRRVWGNMSSTICNLFLYHVTTVAAALAHNVINYCTGRGSVVCAVL